MSKLIEAIEKEELRRRSPDFRAGDTVRVHTKVREGNRERIQIFQGVVIQRKGSGIRETFTVRKNSFGIGVERIFPLHSPFIDKIELVKTGRVRRSRIYYIRKRTGKKSRLRERILPGQAFDGLTVSEAIEVEPRPEPESTKEETSKATAAPAESAPAKTTAQEAGESSPGVSK
ncbi:MAG: 50S ribosomal protein L19 [Candidatus Hydrogenedentota bacterium]|nr:MAG: 50S ribosomal protein L19 [Candidatus Hydrogenedentota bacterium]